MQRQFSWKAFPISFLALVALLCGGGWYWTQTHALHNSEHRSSSVENSKQTDEPPTTSDHSAEEETVVVEFPVPLWSAAGLKIEDVKTGVVAESISLTGKISLNEDKLAHIFPLVDGRVDEVNVRFGQKVKKGELLVVVQSKEVGQAMLQLFQDRLKLEFAEIRKDWIQEVSKNTLALIEMMRNGVTVEEIERTFEKRTIGDYREKLMSAYVAFLKAQIHMQRLTPLSQSGAVPGRQATEAEAELNAVRAGLQSLLEQISQDSIQATRLAEQEVKELQTAIAVSETNLKILGIEDSALKEIHPNEQGEQLAHYPITAPFDGTVITKDVVLLERVGPEQQILTIADLSSVWVTADIYESHLPLLQKLQNHNIIFRSDAWPEKRFQAKVFYTGDVVQESTRTIALQAVAPNEEGLLKPGMFVTVELPDLETTESLQVPVSAVLDHEGKTFVFVQTGDDSFSRVDVSTGRKNQDRIEVRSGLKAGDRVVTSGGFALKSRMLADLLAE